MVTDRCRAIGASEQVSYAVLQMAGKRSVKIDLSRSADTCLFCFHPATLTAEHIWDDWLTEAYKQETKYGEKFNFTDYDGDGQAIRSYPDNKINKKVRVVCAECNNGWMSNITNAVRSMLKDSIVHGKPASLTQCDFESLARFMYLKGAVVDHLSPRPNSFFRPSNRRDFRTTRTLPDGIQVWISQFVSPKAEGQVWAIYSTPNDPAMSIYGSEFLSMTYHVGFVIFQLVVFRWISRNWRHKKLPSITQHSVWDPVAVQIWPNRTMPMKWPSAKYLDADGRKAFRERFKNLRLK